MQNLKKNNKGFTLVELIVVIAILGVLMAVLVPQYIQYVEKSRIGVDESAVSEVAHAIEISMADEAVYDSLPKADFTVTVSESAIGDSITTSTTLTDEITKTVTATAFKSKAYNDGTFTIPVDYTAAGTYVVGKISKGASATVGTTASTTTVYFTAA